MMKQWFEKIKEQRKLLDMSQDELAKKVGYSSRTTIAKIEAGKIDLTRAKVLEFANALEVTPEYLLGIDDEVGTDNDYIDYPVIGEISAGYGGIAYEETSDVESIPKNWLKGHNRDEFLVLKVKGDSCYPTLMDGDKILVRRESSVDSGTLACVIYDGELATVKRVHYKRENPTWLKLEPINSNYPPVVLEGEAELSKCVMIGKVIRAIREF